MKNIAIVVLVIFNINLNAEINKSELVQNAKELCIEIETSGYTEEYIFKGNAQAKLENIFKKIGINVGTEGSGEIINKKYSGVFQKDLITAIKDGNECRLKAFTLLTDLELKVLEQKKHVKDPSPIYNQFNWGWGGMLVKNIEIGKYKNIKLKILNPECRVLVWLTNISFDESSPYFTVDFKPTESHLLAKPYEKFEHTFSLSDINLLSDAFYSSQSNISKEDWRKLKKFYNSNPELFKVQLVMRRHWEDDKQCKGSYSLESTLMHSK